MNATRETLAARLRSGPLSVREATQICRALLSAIETAHARGTGFGGGAITPSTIVLEAGRPVLVSGSQPSATALASDLFAVATVLYESVSGRSWPAGAHPASADWSGIPRRLRRVLQRALDHRHQRLQVGPGGELGDDPAVGGVQRVLRADDVREQAWTIGNHRRRGFIAGCLDRQDAPGVGDYSGVLLSSPSISSVCMMSLKRFLKVADWIESDHMTIASSLLSV